MIELIGSITNNVLAKAIEKTTIENKLIANNIANINTSGYRPLTTQNSDAYNQLISAITDKNYTSIQNLVDEWKPENDVVFRSTAEKVSLNQEMVKLAKNTLLFESLVTAKSQLSSILSVAIKGGNQ